MWWLRACVRSLCKSCHNPILFAAGLRMLRVNVIKCNFIISVGWRWCACACVGYLLSVRNPSRNLCHSLCTLFCPTVNTPDDCIADVFFLSLLFCLFVAVAPINIALAECTSAFFACQTCKCVNIIQTQIGWKPPPWQN